MDNLTRHAARRAQQRGVPPLITEWLLDYGAERQGGRGAVIHFFDRGSRRRLRRAVGAPIVSKLSSYLDCYLVRDGGDIVTVGHRYRRLNS